MSQTAKLQHLHPQTRKPQASRPRGIRQFGGAQSRNKLQVVNVAAAGPADGRAAQGAPAVPPLQLAGSRMVGARSNGRIPLPKPTPQSSARGGNNSVRSHVTLPKLPQRPSGGRVPVRQVTRGAPGHLPPAAPSQAMAQQLSKKASWKDM